MDNENITFLLDTIKNTSGGFHADLLEEFLGLVVKRTETIQAIDLQPLFWRYVEIRKRGGPKRTASLVAKFTGLELNKLTPKELIVSMELALDTQNEEIVLNLIQIGKTSEDHETAHKNFKEHKDKVVFRREN